MTSTTGGADAPSLGWIGRTAIAARQRQPHINVFGGEDRFWLGPEGGQFSLYFKPGDPFDLDHWQVPDAIDWGKWDVDSQSANAVRFRKRVSLVNYTGTRFDIEVDRTVRLLATEDFVKHLSTSLGSGVRMVAFESSNTVTNAGRERAARIGLVSVWILGMFTPSPDTTIAIPFVTGPESTRCPTSTTRISAKSPTDRLRVKEPVILFEATGSIAARLAFHSCARARWPAATMAAARPDARPVTRVRQMPTPT